MPESDTAAYRAALDRANSGDLAGYLDFYSDDVVFGGVTPEPMDKAGTVAFHEGFYSAFSETRVDLLELVEAGDKLAARLSISGRHKGEFMGAPPSGNDVRLAITTILTMRDGKCVERWSTADMFGLMIQIGAIAAPAG